MSIRTHRDAVIAALQGDLAGAVFKPYEAPAETKRYAVVWASTTESPQSRYAGRQVREVFTFTIHAFGRDDDQASWVAERVMKLKGTTLTVPGRRLWPTRFVTAQPAELDDDGPLPLQRIAIQFTIVSDPV